MSFMPFWAMMSPKTTVKPGGITALIDHLTTHIYLVDNTEDNQPKH